MQVLTRLFRYLTPYWKTLVLSIILLLAHSAVDLVPPLFQRQIVGGVIETGDLTRLGVLIAALVAVYLVLQVLSAGDMFVRHALGEKFIFDLRVRLYAYLQRLSLSFFERTSTGELMSRVTNDVSALENFVTHGSALTAAAFLRLLGGAVILFVLDARLALLVLIPVPILAISLRWFNTRIRPIYRRVRARLGDINAQLQDNLSGIRVIQAFGQESRSLTRFTTESEGYYQARVEGIRYWSTFFPAMRFVASLGTVIVLGAGAIMVVNGSLSLGTLVAFLAYVVSFYQPINRLTEIDNVFQEAIAAGERIFELLDHVPEIVTAPDALVLPSVDASETFGLVQLEAMASGVPVVATDLPTGVREVGEPGRTCLLVPPGDPLALSRTLDDLWNGAVDAREMGAAGRTRFEALYSREMMIDRLIEWYETMTPSNPGDDS